MGQLVSTALVVVGGEKEPYHTLMSQLGKYTKNGESCCDSADCRAEQRTVCVCLFADKKTSFHTIDVTVIYSLVRSSRAVGRFKNSGGKGQVVIWWAVPLDWNRFN